MNTPTLGELEEVLRGVDEFLKELFQPADEGQEERVRQALQRLRNRPVALTQLPRLLSETYEEIRDALDVLLRGKSELKEIASDRLSSTHAKLLEVSHATETAATAMLDQLDRALVLVDDIDVLAGGDPTEQTDKLRTELHGLISALQFQDITSQQLRHASSLIEDLEDRLSRVLGVFEESGLSVPADVSSPAPQDGSDTFDRKATTLDPEARQAMADAIFG